MNFLIVFKPMQMAERYVFLEQGDRFLYNSPLFRVYRSYLDQGIEYFVHFSEYFITWRLTELLFMESKKKKK
jgi:hypothetical protein